MYWEIRNDKERDEMIAMLKDRKMPYKVQAEQMYNKRSVASNKMFHGVLIRTFMKYTGYTFFESKAWLTIMFATVMEFNVDDNPKIGLLLDKFNIYQVNNTIYVVEKTSLMTTMRFNEFTDHILIWFTDQDIKLTNNDDYKHEAEMELVL
jgi:hypothetical protein